MRRLAEREQAILDAAAAVAGEGGMAAVQIAPVAHRAEIAAGTVYRYFPSKRDLIGALVERVAIREAEAMRQAAAAAPGPLSALAAALMLLARRAVQSRRLTWALVGEPVDAETQAARAGYRRVLAGELQQLVEAAIAAGLIPLDQTAGFAAPAIFGALIEGLVGPLAPKVEPGPGQRDAVQAFTLMALRALGIGDARARGLVVQAAVPGASQDVA